jgi:hypothetical protein
MDLTEEDKNFMINVLRTMIYNNIDDLKIKLINNKNLLSKEKYNLLLYGNEYLLNDTKIRESVQYKVIKELDNRWCLSSVLEYHLNRTKRITWEQYNEILCI